MHLHHLGDITTDAQTALITGDPDRVPLLAEDLGTVKTTWTKRGYVCAEVWTADEPILVCSTGIGGPTTAIVVEELAQLGVSRLIRVGTCGSMQAKVRAGHIVISSGAVRDEGTSHQYLPPEYPAVPSFALLRAVADAAEAEGAPHHVGITHCKDAYYAEKPDGFPRADDWRKRWAELRSAGVLATEMEAAVLFAVAAVRGPLAAALFVAVDSTLSPDETLASLRTAARVAARGAAATR
ncbi:nucleoside phosphorylase [Dactylosporangium sp. NPDC051485]|uniref:nucleoside phosphorylase n=1 Tax=Dactylosporangium sp. NPDC051485 TaxID=3154846 RepID=UPI003433E370